MLHPDVKEQNLEWTISITLVDEPRSVTYPEGKRSKRLAYVPLLQAHSRVSEVEFGVAKEVVLGHRLVRP